MSTHPVTTTQSLPRKIMTYRPQKQSLYSQNLVESSPEFDNGIDLIDIYKPKNNPNRKWYVSSAVPESTTPPHRTVYKPTSSNSIQHRTTTSPGPVPIQQITRSNMKNNKFENPARTEQSILSEVTQGLDDQLRDKYSLLLDTLRSKKTSPEKMDMSLTVATTLSNHSLESNIKTASLTSHPLSTQESQSQDTTPNGITFNENTANDNSVNANATLTRLTSVVPSQTETITSSPLPMPETSSLVQSATYTTEDNKSTSSNHREAITVTITTKTTATPPLLSIPHTTNEDGDLKAMSTTEYDKVINESLVLGNKTLRNGHQIVQSDNALNTSINMILSNVSSHAIKGAYISSTTLSETNTNDPGNPSITSTKTAQKNDTANRYSLVDLLSHLTDNKGYELMENFGTTTVASTTLEQKTHATHTVTQQAPAVAYTASLKRQQAEITTGN